MTSSLRMRMQPEETAAPIAQRHGLMIGTDDELIESTNVFQGQKVSPGDGALRDPRNWWHLRNPRIPSWGEPYRQIAARMTRAVLRARADAAGHRGDVGGDLLGFFEVDIAD